MKEQRKMVYRSKISESLFKFEKSEFDIYGNCENKRLSVRRRGDKYQLYTFNNKTKKESVEYENSDLDQIAQKATSMHKSCTDIDVEFYTE